ncbi:hypothetical protein [Tissierella praeacuta]|uniref:hypothetical protein n=1 Tax=Tissierella praeacuta TaxID=43131 RepID=UPI0028A86E4D|nr:hypothetical protein [Tissierella praeacuta]
MKYFRKIAFFLPVLFIFAQVSFAAEDTQHKRVESSIKMANSANNSVLSEYGFIEYNRKDELTDCIVPVDEYLNFLGYVSNFNNNEELIFKNESNTIEIIDYEKLNDLMDLEQNNKLPIIVIEDKQYATISEINKNILLNESKNISIVKLVKYAYGLTRTAEKEQLHILRKDNKQKLILNIEKELKESEKDNIVKYREILKGIE